LEEVNEMERQKTITVERYAGNARKAGPQGRYSFLGDGDVHTFDPACEGRVTSECGPRHLTECFI
jgi:hypothetical protein